jgi:hypothetical protein
MRDRVFAKTQEAPSPSVRLKLHRTKVAAERGRRRLLAQMQSTATSGTRPQSRLSGHCPSRSSVAREPTHQARQFVKFRLFPRRRHEPLPEASKRLPTHSLRLLGNVGWVIPDPLEVGRSVELLDHLVPTVGQTFSRPHCLAEVAEFQLAPGPDSAVGRHEQAGASPARRVQKEPLNSTQFFRGIGTNLQRLPDIISRKGPSIRHLCPRQVPDEPTPILPDRNSRLRSRRWQDSMVSTTSVDGQICAEVFERGHQSSVRRADSPGRFVLFPGFGVGVHFPSGRLLEGVAVIPEFEDPGRWEERVRGLVIPDAPRSLVPRPREDEVGVDSAQESHD